MDSDIRFINEIVRKESAFVDPLMEELGRVVVGQQRMLETLLIGILTGGHILLEGVPGLAKTLTVQTLADVIETQFQRIQFTPDLLPADILGTMVYNQKTGEFTPHRGPIFANIVLADEINRAPAKVQSALLEAMQEKQVTIGDTTYKLDPLPEAQVDRFMLKVVVDYPSRDEERVIMERMTGIEIPTARPVIKPDEILKAREVLHQVYVDEKIKRYILDIVFATREPAAHGLGRLKDFISYGASPRASLFLLNAARAQAFLRHRGYVIPEDVKEVAMEVLRHRVVLTYEAEAEELAPEGVIRQILDEVEVP
jgi:MoxR-like ATPase